MWGVTHKKRKQEKKNRHEHTRTRATTTAIRRRDYPSPSSRAASSCATLHSNLCIHAPLESNCSSSSRTTRPHPHRPHISHSGRPQLCTIAATQAAALSQTYDQSDQTLPPPRPRASSRRARAASAAAHAPPARRHTHRPPAPALYPSDDESVVAMRCRMSLKDGSFLAPNASTAVIT